MKVYQWNNAELHKEYKIYTGAMWACAVVTLALLYLLPENLKVWNFVPLILGMLTCFGWWNARRKDEKLKKAK